MMGIYVKDMKKPHRCANCPFRSMPIYNTRGQVMYVCKIYGKENTNEVITLYDGALKAFPDWCPLVEVPEPHGKLVDIDNVIAAIYDRLHVLQTHKVFIKKHGDIDLLGVLPYIFKIPTVIEAED